MISIGPFRCRRCCLQGFYPAAPDLSEVIPFVYLACLLSLRCLISALTQAGGGDLLGSLVQFSPAAGRAGRCRQMSLCVWSSRRVLAKQPAVLGTTPWVLRAFSLRGERLGWPEVCARSPGCGVPFPSAASCPGRDGAALLWSFSVPLFCEPPAVCSGRSIFLSRSPTV